MALYLEVSTLRQWPYRKLTKADQHVVARFFDSEPFFAHGWEIYHYETNSKDVFLIPFTQILEFFAQITAETGIAAFKNISPSKIAFRVDHDSDDEPAFIGIIESKDDFDRLKESVSWNDADHGAGRGPQDRQRKKDKQKEKMKRSMSSWRAQVESAMLYLGFLSEDANIDNIQKPVFVSVDVESYERNHNAITEVGISILDTSRLPPQDAQYAVSNDSSQKKYIPRNNIPAVPKSRAEAILGLVESHHFRIKENRHLRNGTFVSDAADNFEFGSSEYISLKEAPDVIAKCFRHFDEQEEKRRIVLVGHDTKTDIDYLRKLGYSVTNIADLEIMDTASMWKAITWEKQGRSLSTILMELELESWNLHNAGNDAAYTLQAVIKMAEKGLTETKPEDSGSGVASASSSRSVARAEAIARAEDIEISLIEGEDTRPIGWKVAKERNAAVKPAPIPIPTTTGYDGASDEGSPLSANGDGW